MQLFARVLLPDRPNDSCQWRNNRERAQRGMTVRSMRVSAGPGLLGAAGEESGSGPGHAGSGSPQNALRKEKCGRKPAVPATEASGSALDADGYVVVPTGLPARSSKPSWTTSGAMSVPDRRPRELVPAGVIRPGRGMVEMYHYQSMWDVRQHPAVYRFSAPAPHGRIVGLHRPGRVQAAGPAGQPEFDQPASSTGTPTSTGTRISPSVQGVLALEDTPPTWAASSASPPSTVTSSASSMNGPGRSGPRAPDIGDHPIVKVPLAAGDLAIWKTTLLHGNGRSSPGAPGGPIPRHEPAAPSREQRETARRNRIMSWPPCAPPDDHSFPGATRLIEEQRGEQASLGPLAGAAWIDEWPESLGTPSSLPSAQIVFDVPVVPSVKDGWGLDRAGPCPCGIDHTPTLLYKLRCRYRSPADGGP